MSNAFFPKRSTVLGKEIPSEKKSFSFLGREAANGEQEEKKLQSLVLKGLYFKQVQITFPLYISSASLFSSTINTSFLYFYDMILIIFIF